MNNPLIAENQITKEKIFKSNSIDEKVHFDGGLMITENDTKGIIDLCKL